MERALSRGLFALCPSGDGGGGGGGGDGGGGGGSRKVSFNDERRAGRTKP